MIFPHVETSWDTKLDIWTSDGNFLTGDDNNGSSCAGNTASINWTSTETGVIYAIVHDDVCGSSWPSTSALLNLRQNTNISNTTSTSDICMNGSKALTAEIVGINENPVVLWSILSGGGVILDSTYYPEGYIGKCFDSSHNWCLFKRCNIYL
jgi:NifU-like protein involved in Fe-S cluster formation